MISTAIPGLGGGQLIKSEISKSSLGFGLEGTVGFEGCEGIEGGVGFGAGTDGGDTTTGDEGGDTTGLVPDIGGVTTAEAFGSKSKTFVVDL